MQSLRHVYDRRRVLVTGADGFIGSHLVEALAGAGAQVTALALYNAFGTAGWLDEIDVDGIEIRRGDVRDAAFVNELVAGHDVVFHLAALIAIPYSYVAPQSYVDANVTGTLNVLEACRRHAVARMVHTSTSEVYGTAQFTPITETHPLQGQSPYAASKIGADKMAEAYARSFELPVVTLRPFNTYGPRQSERAVIPSIIRQVLDPSCNALRLGSLTPTRDFNYVGDIAAAFMHAGVADLDGATAYNAGTGRAVAIADIVALVREQTGVDKPVECESARTRPLQSEVHELIASAERFTAASGWRPTVILEDGVASTIAWWLRRIATGRARPSADHLI